MYILQEKDRNYWFDKTKSNYYEFIIELYNIYCEKYQDKVFRVIEVFIYV